jgi:hypothetical protein
MTTGQSFEFSSSKPALSKKFKLHGSLFREPEGAKKDWFGYLNIAESEFEGFARALREAPRVTNRDGGKAVCFKIAGWNRQANGKAFISLAIDDL